MFEVQDISVQGSGKQLKSRKLQVGKGGSPPLKTGSSQRWLEMNLERG